MPSKTLFMGYLNSGSIGVNLAEKSSTLWLQSCKHDYQQSSRTVLLLVQDENAEQNWEKAYPSNKVQAVGMAEAGLWVRELSGHRAQFELLGQVLLVMDMVRKRR